MPVLGNFTQNSEFPAIGKLPSISYTFEMPAKRYEGGEEETSIANITIPSASIVMPAITAYLFTGFGSIYIDRGVRCTVTVKVERTSATNVRITWHIVNRTNLSEYWSGNNYRIDLALFNVP